MARRKLLRQSSILVRSPDRNSADSSRVTRNKDGADTLANCLMEFQPNREYRYRFKVFFGDFYRSRGTCEEVANMGALLHHGRYL
jgi:hypothetical protein